MVAVTSGRARRPKKSAAGRPSAVGRLDATDRISVSALHVQRYVRRHVVQQRVKRRERVKQAQQTRYQVNASEHFGGRFEPGAKKQNNALCVQTRTAFLIPNARRLPARRERRRNDPSSKRSGSNDDGIRSGAVFGRDGTPVDRGADLLGERDEHSRTSDGEIPTSHSDGCVFDGREKKTS